MYNVEIATIENSRLLGWVRVFASTQEKTAYGWALNLRSGFSSLDSRPSVRLVKSPQDSVIEIWK